MGYDINVRIQENGELLINEKINTLLSTPRKDYQIVIGNSKRMYMKNSQHALTLNKTEMKPKPNKRSLQI